MLAGGHKLTLANYSSSNLPTTAVTSVSNCLMGGKVSKIVSEYNVYAVRLTIIMISHVLNKCKISRSKPSPSKQLAKKEKKKLWGRNRTILCLIKWHISYYS